MAGREGLARTTLLLLAVLPLVSGSHFRYGSLTWTALVDDYDFSSTGQTVQAVEFSVIAAYRRDYVWGADPFYTQWAQTSDDSPEKTFYGNEYYFNNDGEPVNCPISVEGIDPTGVARVNAMNDPDRPACQNTAPMLDLGVDSNGNGINNEKFYLKFPSLRQEAVGAGSEFVEVVQCPTPFFCDVVDPTGQDQSAQAALCDRTLWLNNPSRELSNGCAPWNDVYGMFTGDGTSFELELEVTQLETEQQKGQILGNYLVGRGTTVKHYYAMRTSYTAFFTGGDRLSECVASVQNNQAISGIDDAGRCLTTNGLLLNNNAEGRFRLETEVLLHGDLIRLNQPPRPTMMAVVPLPRGTQAAPRSRFQVAAFDPDGDQLVFRFGTSEEYGGVMRSKSSRYPLSKLNVTHFERYVEDQLYGTHECEETTFTVVTTGFCPSDRVPMSPPHAEEHSFTSPIPGLIEWTTFGTPAIALEPPVYCPEVDGDCDTQANGLRSGLYNFVVMVSDVTPPDLESTYSGRNTMSKTAVDFMAYLYDGPMFFCNAECRSNVGGAPTWATPDGVYDTCTVCGLGPSAEGNYTACGAERVGDCGSLVGSTLVPPTDACVMNRRPYFVQAAGGSVDGVVETPQLGRWEAVHDAIQDAGADDIAEGTYPYPEVKVNVGQDIAFWVTVKDDDSCTELSLDATWLPDGSSLSPPEQSEDTDGGVLVRRKFEWVAPFNGDESMDSRLGARLVCFTALDSYFAVADPYYCVNVVVREKPETSEETLLRFNCKMALLWSPVVQRFVFADGDQRYYTACRYENFMWHHAMVVTEETAAGSIVGQLYIDGEPAELMTPVDDSMDLTMGFNAAGTSFTTEVYPTMCEAKKKRRSLLTAGDGVNDRTDSPVQDGFLHPDVYDGTSGLADCCSFRIAQACEEVGSYDTFAGLLDEVAVWNRALRPAEVKETLFHMPQLASARKLQAPRGVPVDYTAGRVLYVRFNNPCDEGPLMPPPPPPSPPPPRPPVVDDDSRRRRLFQLSEHAIADGSRRDFPADHAGFTAGSQQTNGTLVFTDTFSDTSESTPFFRNFGGPTAYAFTGVPWAAPYVNALSTLSGASVSPVVPLDGVTMVAHGVGFAASAFAKCVLVQPDLADTFDDIESDDDGAYDNYYVGASPALTRFMHPTLANRFSVKGQVAKTPAMTKFDVGLGVPALHRLVDFHSPASQNLTGFDDDDISTRYGKINAFQTPLPYGARTRDYVYGTWEQMECVMPAAAFPSNAYSLSVSNDAGITASPPVPVTYMDTSVALAGTGSLDLNSQLRSLSSSFTVSLWVYPSPNAVPPNLADWQTNQAHWQTVIDLGERLRVVYTGHQGGTFHAVLDGDLVVASRPDPWTATVWHHLVLAVSNREVELTIDLERADFTETLNAPGFTGPPPELVLGAGFQGHLDEVKLWSRKLSVEEVRSSHVAYSRELPGDASTGAVGYFRFNNVTEYIDSAKTLMNSVAGAPTANGEGTFSYEPMAVPWEPSSVTSVNGVPLLASPRIIPHAPQTGIDATVTLEGFNFAKSFNTKCTWGSTLSEPLPVPALGLSEEVQPSQVGDCSPPEGPNLVLEALDGPEGAVVSPMKQGTLGRPDGRGSLMEPYPAYTVGTPLHGETSTTSSNPIEQTDTSLTCDVPAVQRPQFAVLTAGNVPTVTPVPFEFAEVALYCEGSNHLSADSVAQLVSDGDGYTMGAWVFPYAEGDALEHRRGRSLRSTDKNLRRKLAGHAGKVASTVLGFEAQAAEGAAVTNDGLLMYDGQRFFYYDDCILDVTQTGAIAAPGEWHFVMVSIAADGEGMLNVDGHREAFSTTCKPKATGGLFSMCQDYMLADGARTAGAHFRGLVDEVQIFRRVLSYELTERFMFTPYPLAAFPSTVGGVQTVGQEERVAYFAFADPYNMLPYAATLVPEDAALPWAAESGGPWYPPTVIDVEPEHAALAGGTKLTVTGTNLARSQWLSVDLGGPDLTVPVEQYLPAGVVVTSAPAPAGGEFPVRGQSHDSDEGTGAALFDTTITYAPAVADLHVGLVSRMSFAFVAGATPTIPFEDSATFVDIKDLSCADWAGDCSVASPSYIAACPVVGRDAVGPDGSTCEVGGSIDSYGYYYSKAHMDELREHCPVSCHTGAATAIVVDLVSGEVAHSYPIAHWAAADVYRAADRDLFANGAVVFDAAHPVTLATPPAGSAGSTVCAWLRMDVGAQAAPLPGAWKLVCAVNTADADTQIYFNGVQQPPSLGGWYAMALSDNVLGGEAEHGVVSDVWVYDHALPARALQSLYYTQQFALHFDGAAGPAAPAPASLTVPLGGDALKFTLSMWVFPHTTQGWQTLAATDAAPQLTDVFGLAEGAALGLSFGLHDMAATMAIFHGCDCTPCANLMQYTSPRSKVLPMQWSHLTFVFPAMEGQNPNTVAILVDGMLRDLHTFTPPATMPPIPVSLTLLLGQESTLAPSNGDVKPFDGLIYDLAWSTSPAVPWQVKMSTQCPTLARTADATVYSFNEGVGSHAGGGGAAGLARRWTNASYDDVTSPASTTLFGHLQGQLGGETGHIVVTSRTACSKKRVFGGDAYDMTLTADDGPRPGETFPQRGKVVTLDAPRDTNDGNYHFQYTLAECAVYRASLTLDGEELESFDVDIRPGATDPDKTFIEGYEEGQTFDFPEPACFGVQTTFVIFARDQAGCLVSGHDDIFRVTLDGPHTLHAVVTPDAAIDGKYHVAFTPEAPGDYHLEVVLVQPDGTESQIRSGRHFCVSVCGEGALSLSGTAGATVIEDGDPPDSAGSTPLDLSYPGITMELWFKFPADFASTETVYLLHKGGADQLGNETKSWAVMLRGNLMSAEVYVGQGVTRAAEADVATQLNAAPTDWHHLAVTYDGQTFAMYLDGVSKAVSGTFVGNMPPQPNSYSHPLLIGGNMPGGMVDEVKLWKVARTAEQIAGSMFCAPFNELEHVAAYFSFNEGEGAVLSGQSADCAPGSPAEVAKQCLQGTLGLGATFTRDSTPVTFTEKQGYAAPSASFSTVTGDPTEYAAGSEEALFAIAAMNKCGYRYTAPDPRAFTVATQIYRMDYWDERMPYGVEYPVQADTPLTTPIDVKPAASRRCPGTGLPGPARGDEFPAYLGEPGQLPTRTAGEYLLHVRDADQQLVGGEPLRLSVVATAPAKFSMHPMGVGLAAGAPSAMRVQLRDRWDNIVFKQFAFSATVALVANEQGEQVAFDEGVSLAAEEMVFDATTGDYTLLLTLGFPGAYNLTLTGSEEATAAVESYTETFSVTAAAWRKLLTDDMSVPMPTRRFEHTATVEGGDVYIFGGAMYDRTYLNDMYVLTGAAEASGKVMELGYRKTIAFDYTILAEKAITIAAHVDTAELIAANRMNPSCLDVLFTLPGNGEALPFYLDPSGQKTADGVATGGCNTTRTTYWVTLPAGAVSPYQFSQTVDMFYGSPTLGVTTVNTYHDPAAVFALYEGFEANGTGVFSQTTLCNAEATPNDLETTDTNPYAGSGSLYAKAGAVTMLAAPLPMPLADYQLRAWFYDSDATVSSHYISPDLADACAVDAAGKRTLADGGPVGAESSAVGTFTLASPYKYCVASPWESVGDGRSAGWHQFVVTAAAGAITVEVDGVVVKTVAASPTTGTPSIDQVLLSAGFGVDGTTRHGLADNHAFWDEIIVAAVEPSVTEVTATAMDADEAVALSETRVWRKLTPSGTPPPPRQAHTTISYDGKLWVFGGERSSYAFNDVWAYDIAADSWSFVTPAAGALPTPRHDHTAVVTADGVMLVYGGRQGMTALSDLWALDLRTATWTLVTDTLSADGLGTRSRYSHAAVIPPGSSAMYVFGGYSGEDAALSNTFDRCDVTTGVCVNLNLGCDGTSTSFMPSGLTPRYEHSVFADSAFVYVYGGAAADSLSTGLGDVYKFSLLECAWEVVPAVTPVPRSEHVAGLLGDGFFVHGGHASGEYFDDTFWHPL